MFIEYLNYLHDEHSLDDLIEPDKINFKFIALDIDFITININIVQCINDPTCIDRSTSCSGYLYNVSEAFVIKGKKRTLNNIVTPHL